MSLCCLCCNTIDLWWMQMEASQSPWFVENLLRTRRENQGGTKTVISSWHHSVTSRPQSSACPVTPAMIALFLDKFELNSQQCLPCWSLKVIAPMNDFTTVYLMSEWWKRIALSAAKHNEQVLQSKLSRHLSDTGIENFKTWCYSL